MLKLDETDKRLLGFLQADCKQPTAAYARQSNLSTTAIYERIKRLEKSGAIEAYVALVNRKKVNKSFTVLCQVRLSQHSKANVIKFEREILKLNEVVECFHTSGDYDYMIKVHVSDMEAYREFMVAKLTAIDNIGSTQSSFVINEVKHTTAIQL